MRINYIWKRKIGGIVETACNQRGLIIFETRSFCVRQSMRIYLCKLLEISRVALNSIQNKKAQLHFVAVQFFKLCPPYWRINFALQRCAEKAKYCLHSAHGSLPLYSSRGGYKRSIPYRFASANIRDLYAPSPRTGLPLQISETCVRLAPVRVCLCKYQRSVCA